MASPSKDWNDIADSRTDADSPLDTTLVTDIRDNLVHLREWLGSSFSPAVDHDHDGVNSQSVVLADETVTVAKLKKAQGSFNTTVPGIYDVTINRYSHLPRIQATGFGPNPNVSVALHLGTYTGADVGPVVDRIRVEITADDPMEDNYNVYWDYHAN